MRFVNIPPSPYAGRLVMMATSGNQEPRIAKTNATRIAGHGADQTPQITLSVKTADLPTGDYAVYLGDTPRRAGESVNPNRTEWIQGTTLKMFSADDLNRGVELTAWCATGPKYVTIANAETDEVAVPSQKIIVR